MKWPNELLRKRVYPGWNIEVEERFSWSYIRTLTWNEEYHEISAPRFLSEDLGRGMKSISKTKFIVPWKSYRRTLRNSNKVKLRLFSFLMKLLFRLSFSSKWREKTRQFYLHGPAVSNWVCVRAPLSLKSALGKCIFVCFFLLLCSGSSWKNCEKK